MLVNQRPTFQANAAMDPYLRVKLSSEKLVAAGASDDEIGTTEKRVLAADDYVAVLPRGIGGVRKMVASKAISKHALVYTAADGKVSDTQATGAFESGTALEAASGDESIINVLEHTDRTAGS